MDIAVVSYEWPGVTSNCGGGGRIGAELVDGLRDRGHVVNVLTDDDDGNYMTFPARSYRRLKRQITDGDTDVVHGLFSLPSSLGLPRLCRQAKVPLVVSVMGADVYDPTRFDAIRSVANVANRYIYAGADRVVAPSTDMARRVNGRTNGKLEVIRYGLDPSDWPWSVHGRHIPFHVLTVCRLVERKNLRTAFTGLQQLHRTTDYAPEWRIVGTGPLRNELEDRFGKHEWVTFRGYVDDLIDEYHWADAFYLPSKHEAFGVVFLEALANGLPVVTSDVGGQTDIISDPVGKAVPANPEQLAEAVERLIENYDEYQQATKNYVSKRFSRERMVKNYEQIYQEVSV